MKEFIDILKALGLVFGVPLLAFFLMILPFLGPLFTLCPHAISGSENTLGARIYLNEEFAGVMEQYKYKVGEEEYTDIRLCTRIKDGDRLRAEKEGYETYTATLETSYNDSGDPSTWVTRRLTPIGEDKTK
jgi:hypothetical protein